jgi:hypothetical protein
MLGETWEDQYKRLHRQHERLKKAADQNVQHGELQEESNARDTLFHFCLDALILRDWISRAASLPQSVQQDVWKLFDVKNNPSQASRALAACHDVANGYKHFVVDRPKTPGGAAKVIDHTRGARFPMKLPFHFGANHWTIDVGGGVRRDALDLAADAIADWDAWLTGHGVPLPS